MAWGFLALSVLLWISQRAQPAASNLRALSIFLIAALTVWVLTSRRVTRHGTGTERPSEASDRPSTIEEQPEGVAEESCPVCALTVSSSDQACKCGAPRVTDADRQPLRGPRGWLAVYRFGLLVLAPLEVAAVIATSLGNGSDFSTGDWLRVLPAILLVAGPALYGVFVAALLAHERPESVRHARQHLVRNLICEVGFIVRVCMSYGARATVDLMRYLLVALIGGFSGREFLAHDPVRQLFLAGRVFLVGRKTITLLAVTAGVRTPSQATASGRFLNSFAIADQ